jgi:hypothetical protein
MGIRLFLGWLKSYWNRLTYSTVVRVDDEVIFHGFSHHERSEEPEGEPKGSACVTFGLAATMRSLRRRLIPISRLLF